MMIQAEKVDEGISESGTEAILHFQISGPANLSLRWEIGAKDANSSYLTNLIQISNRSRDFLSCG